MPSIRKEQTRHPLSSNLYSHSSIGAYSTFDCLLVQGAQSLRCVVKNSEQVLQNEVVEFTCHLMMQEEIEQGKAQ